MRRQCVDRRRVRVIEPSSVRERMLTVQWTQRSRMALCVEDRVDCVTWTRCVTVWPTRVRTTCCEQLATCVAERQVRVMLPRRAVAWLPSVRLTLCWAMRKCVDRLPACVTFPSTVVGRQRRVRRTRSWVCRRCVEIRRVHATRPSTVADRAQSVRRMRWCPWVVRVTMDPCVRRTMRVLLPGRVKARSRACVRQRRTVTMGIRVRWTRARQAHACTIREVTECVDRRLTCATWKNDVRRRRQCVPRTR